jgi:hypothetical protein
MNDVRNAELAALIDKQILLADRIWFAVRGAV